MTTLSIWQPQSAEVIPTTARTPEQVADCAVQLSMKDKRQIVAAFQVGHYEIALNHLWGKTIAALKKELSTVGIELIGEMLGRTDVSGDDDVEDILTAKDAIRLAEELGIINTTDALRLRHAYELINHFSQLELEQSDAENIEESEAISLLKYCVKGVLGRPKIEVAKRFVEFRNALVGETLSESDQRVAILLGSPYFFYKLTISVLLSSAKKSLGASLEHTLANLNLLLPKMWVSLSDSERWQVGYCYAEAFSDGKTTVVGGVKSALLKVHGFDYVPENLRSDTFVRAAEAILRAHDGLNNFYNEPAPVKHLHKLGTTIPSPAVAICITALLSVVLGNSYGVSEAAQNDANEMIKKISKDRWKYYLNNVLHGEMRILGKLKFSRPKQNWKKIMNNYSLVEVEVTNKLIANLLKHTKEMNDSKIDKDVNLLVEAYYGK